VTVDVAVGWCVGVDVLVPVNVVGGVAVGVTAGVGVGMCRRRSRDCDVVTARPSSPRKQLASASCAQWLTCTSLTRRSVSLRRLTKRDDAT
jgi:hypothetical protein